MQTASQIRNAQKAAKRNKQIERQAKKAIGAGYGKNRNETAAIRFNQSLVRQSMQSGEPFGEETNINETVKNLLHYQTLIYETDADSMAVFEKLIRGMAVVAHIYGDQKLLICTQEAKKAVEKLSGSEADGYSPNQRRALLRPALQLCSWAEAYSEIVPAKTVIKIGHYCSAVQIALYTTALYNQPKSLVYALFQIIQGKEKFRDLARRAKVKESEFKSELLDAAWLFYRIMECFEISKRPDSITDLKQSAWKPYGDSNELQKRIRRVMENHLIPFENATGITMIDYRKFRNECIEIEKKFLN